MKTKKTIFFAYQQGKVIENLRKIENLRVGQFKIIKDAIICKMSIVKLVDKYPEMMTSSVTLNFLKSCYKDIKNICKENQ